MITAALVAGVFTFVSGVLVALVGWIVYEAGRGGYGRGPFPMVPVSPDRTLKAFGFALALVGSALAAVGVTVVVA